MYDESLSLAISKPQFDAEVQRINKIWCVVSTAGRLVFYSAALDCTCCGTVWCGSGDPGPTDSATHGGPLEAQPS
jgi:hypothetical protein